jgi:predicted O-linked N-acetylglucosamine transferase (SPINDLY family)
VQPGSAETHNNLGIALAAQHQTQEAVTEFRHAVRLKSNYPEAYSNLGAVLTEIGQFYEAVDVLRRALQFAPRNATVYSNLGNALKGQGDLDKAIEMFQRALQWDPRQPEIHNNLGVTFNENRRPDKAAAAFQQALKLKPNYPEAHNNLGNVYKDQARWEEVIPSYRRALQCKPEYREARSNLIYTLLFHPNQDATILAEEQRRWNQQFAEPVRHLVRPLANDLTSERRLRIGYLSSEFRDHVTARHLVPLFEHHDRQNFEILCYAGVTKPDQRTDEFRRRADQWRNTLGLGDEAVAEMIRQDGVDILVDLTQHLAGNRLPVFAHRPAPVQVSFAGYPESAGVEAIPYRISDRYLESEIGGDLPSPISDLRTAEQVFLIDSFWCFDPCGTEVEVNPLPALEKGRVTFGCLNNFCKINEPVLRLWARVLGQVEKARLILLSPVGSHREQALEVFSREGIDARRAEFVVQRPRQTYLESYHRVDIALDPFPYNGHTTSLEALWMGVPVISMAGDGPVSRAGWSQLSNLGLPELVAFSEDDYVRIASRWAGDLPRLAQLRRTLRSRMEASVLMDARHFARSVEMVYRTLWQRWCKEKES